MGVTAKEHIVENPSDVIDRTPILTSAGARERQAGVRDKFSVSAEARKKYGLLDDETPAWVRNPKYYENDDRPQEVADFYACEHDCDGAVRVVRNREMDTVVKQDLILIAIKTDAYQKREAANQAESNALTRSMEEREDGYIYETLESVDDVRRQITDQSRMAQHRQHVASGMIGPTAGLSLTEAERKYTPEQREREAERFRRGAFHRDTNQDDYHKLMGFEPTSERGKKISVSVGDTGLGKSTQAKVAARQPAARRA